MSDEAAWTYRRRWTARMLRQHLHGAGGGGLGLRPVLVLRVPMAALPSRLEPIDGGDAYWRPDALPWTAPAWLSFEDEKALEVWRQGAPEPWTLDAWNAHARRQPATWKFIDLWPGDRWLFVHLSAYGSQDRPPPFAAVAASLTLAWATGVRVGVQVRPRYAASERVIRHIERRLERRLIRAEVRVHRVEASCP